MEGVARNGSFCLLAQWFWLSTMRVDGSDDLQLAGGYDVSYAFFIGFARTGCLMAIPRVRERDNSAYDTRGLSLFTRFNWYNENPTRHCNKPFTSI